MKNIISIDPSLKSTGIYIRTIQGQELFFTFKNNHKTEKELYFEFVYKLNDLINIYKIEICLIEDYAFGIKNTRSLTSLAEIKGLIKSIVLLNNCMIIMVPISSWKLFSKITEKKKDTKKARLNYINQAKNIYKKDFHSTDEVDAYLMFFTLCMIKKGIIKSNAHLQLKKLIDDNF